MEKALKRGFADIHEQYSVATNSIVKLVSCEGEGEDEGFCLKSKLLEFCFPLELL